MGSLHSKTSYIYLDYGYYKSYINTLDTESVSRVYNKIVADKFRTSKQMQACGILIYEKAVEEPNFSLKCAQLLKELEDEVVVEDGNKKVFHVVFSDYMIPFIMFVIDKYDDKYMNKRLVQRGMGFSSFVGNLHNVGFYGLPQIVEIAQKAKKHVTPKSAFFMENILNTCSAKLESKMVSRGFFEMMVNQYRREDFFDSTKAVPKDEPRTEFIKFLHQMATVNRHKFFDKYENFKTIPDQIHKMEIKFLMKYTLENEQFLSIYRFVALQIHRITPNRLKIDLKFEFDKSIEKYEVIQDINRAENIKNLEHLGNVIVEFYTAGLIDDEVVEHFLNVAKSSKVPIKIFNLIFVEVLKKYEGKHLMDYYRYLNKKSKKLPEMQILAEIVEDYIVNRMNSGSVDSEQQLFESEAAAQPDLQKFTSSLYKLHEPFNCDDQPSCHVASLRGLDILMRHSKHAFFTIERIKICSKMTRNFSKIPIEDKIREKIEKEMKIYLPFFKETHAPNKDFKGFWKILIAFYNNRILKHEMIADWMKQLQYVANSKRNRYHQKFLEYYLAMFKKIDNNFLCNDPDSWLMHINFIDNLEFAKIKFDDFKKFKELVENFKDKAEFSDLESLENLEIPNKKIAMKQISQFLIDFYIKNKANPALITSILSKLSAKLDNIVLQSEFKASLCPKLSFIFASNKKEKLQIHNHAVLITDLLEVICIQNQLSQLEISNLFDVVLKRAGNNDNLYPVFNFIKFSYEKLSKVLNKNQEHPQKLAILEDVEKKIDVDDFKIKEFRETFGGFLNDKNKKEGTDENESTSCNSNSQPSPDLHIDIDTIKDYNQYCTYYNNITTKTSEDDNNLFNPNLISTLKIQDKEQVVDLADKFIDRILEGQSTVQFFTKNAQKIGNAIQSMFKLKNQKISFQKILADEICLKFENQEVLVKFMCELYNNSYVNKASMIAFVDKFKSQSPENLVLMHTFVRTCAIRLSSQGDKEQLMQIRTIARSIKNLTNYDEDLKLVAENLESSLDSLILGLEIEDEKIVNNLIQEALNDPQISLRKVDKSFENLLIKKIEDLLKNKSINQANHKNLVEFVARLFNFGILPTNFIIWSIDFFLETSNEEISCQSLEILFRKCGLKLEKTFDPKLSIFFKFFKAILAENENSIRSTYFDRIMKLKSQAWKTIQNSESFYENFLLSFKADESKFAEIIENFMTDDEEIDKFILILWKILLKDEPNPAIVNMCCKTSKYCNEFQVKFSQFLSARSQTFKKLMENPKLFDKNVKHRLGKVMNFVAEIYNKNVAADEILAMWIDGKFIDSVSHEFVSKLFNELSGSTRQEECKSEIVKELVRNIEDKYYGAINAKINLIIDDLNEVNL